MADEDNSGASEISPAPDAIVSETPIIVEASKAVSPTNAPEPPAPAIQPEGRRIGVPVAVAFSLIVVGAGAIWGGYRLLHHKPPAVASDTMPPDQSASVAAASQITRSNMSDTGATIVAPPYVPSLTVAPPEPKPSTFFEVQFQPYYIDAWSKYPVPAERDIFDPNRNVTLTCGKITLVDVSNSFGSSFKVVPETATKLTVETTSKDGTPIRFEFEKGKPTVVTPKKFATGANIGYAGYSALQLLAICSGIITNPNVSVLKDGDPTVGVVVPGSTELLRVRGVSVSPEGMENIPSAPVMTYEEAMKLLAPSPAPTKGHIPRRAISVNPVR